jgi:hypothetical protein
MNRNIVIRLGVGALTAATIACNLSTPVRPSPTVVTGGSNNGVTLKVSAPTPQSPANGVTLGDFSVSGITLSAGAASPEFASPVSLQYQFELMNSAGAVIESSGLMNSPTWRQSSTLEYQTRYSWRLRAAHDGAVGPWSNVFTFTTAELPAEFRCRPPFMSEPFDIMLCHIELLDDFGEPDQRVIWLRRVTRDFNFAGVPGGPYGVLVKRTGHNCEGYSCDILCSGQGNDQRQFDVLVNDTVPVWGGGGADVRSGIRVDVCEIQ